MSEPDLGEGRGPSSFGQRLIGALKLDAETYEEVEHDPGALGQAAGVIALAAVARGLWGVGVGAGAGFIGGLLSAFIGWFVAAGIIWAIGVWYLEHTSDYPELLRTLGFASAPQLLFALGLIPLGPLLGLLAFLIFGLSVAAWVIAVRQALDVSTGRAIGICLLAAIANALLVPVFGAVGL